MTEAEKIQDWVRWYRSAPSGYQQRALEAVVASDGMRMLGAVLKAMKLESSVDLVRSWNEPSSKAGPQKTVEPSDERGKGADI